MIKHLHRTLFDIYDSDLFTPQRLTYEYNQPSDKNNAFMCLQTLSGHSSDVISVVFIGNKNVLSGGTDGTMHLWRIKDGVCLAKFIHAPEGWAMYLANGHSPRYKAGGNIHNYFWHVANHNRFNVGELDEYIPNLRMNDDEPIPNFEL